ncbi:MAG: alpha/beta hydrolase-fold protein [Pigmentiphaga sp.]|nr:alpha/beta hydrolase-fold protein [Pigmentiphaga sp.]
MPLRATDTPASPLRRTLLLALGLAPFSTFSQPANQVPPRPGRDWNEPIGPTIADLPSEHYVFQRLSLESADGQRRYRIDIGTPRRPPPPAGYPALYMLDGNAALHTLQPQDLATLAAGDPPVLIGIGYDVPGRHDVLARAFDYTPPVIRDGQPDPNVEERGRPGGGADIFLDLFEQRIRPEVLARAAIDPRRQTLWGHSYGGLLALHTLMTRPALFQRYVAGDPSMGWHDGVLLRTADGFRAEQAPGVTVRILVGGSQPRRAPGTPPPPPPASVIPGVPPGRESAYQLVERLAAEGMDITFEAFPEQNHGQLFATSLYPALRVAVR